MISQNNVGQVPQRRSTFRTLPEERPSTKKLKETFKCFKSPLFAVQIIMLAIGNCTVSLSLNIVNDLIMRETNGDDAKFEKTQTEFEIARGVISTMSCILMGLATDFSMKMWDKTSSKNKDVQKTLLRLEFYNATMQNRFLKLDIFSISVLLDRVFQITLHSR